MKVHDGHPQIVRVVDRLEQAAAECERRLGAGLAGSALDAAVLQKIGKRARATADALAAADGRKQWALAEVKRADLDLEDVYHDARDGLDEVRAGLFSLFGRQPAELIAFGVTAPSRERKRHRNQAHTAPASPPADGPAPTAGTGAATAAAGAATEVSHHG